MRFFFIIYDVWMCVCVFFSSTIYMSTLSDVNREYMTILYSWVWAELFLIYVLFYSTLMIVLINLSQALGRVWLSKILYTYFQILLWYIKFLNGWKYFCCEWITREILYWFFLKVRIQRKFNFSGNNTKWYLKF